MTGSVNSEEGEMEGEGEWRGGRGGRGGRDRDKSYIITSNVISLESRTSLSRAWLEASNIMCFPVTCTYTPLRVYYGNY